PLPVMHRRVIGQVVVVGVAVVDEAAVLDDQLAGLLARTVAAIPPERALPRGALDPGVALVDGPALRLAVHEVVLFPPVAMPADVVALRGDGARHGRVAFQRDGAGEERAPHLVLREDPQEAPYAHAAAVLEHRFVGQVAPVRWDGRHGIAPRLPPADAVLQEVFRALLVVHDQRDGDARAIRPRHPRRLVCVADQITFGHGPTLLSILPW